MMKKIIFTICFSLLFLSLTVTATAVPPTPTTVVEFLNDTDWWGIKFGTHVADMLIHKLRLSGYYTFTPRPKIHSALTARNLPFNIYLSKSAAVDIGEDLNTRLVITGKIESIKVTKYYRYVPPPRPRRYYPPPRGRVVERHIASLKIKIKVKVVDVEKDKVIWEGSKTGDATFPKGVLVRPGSKGKWAADHADQIIREALDKIAKEINKKTEYLR
jgi:hypothetical protein